MIVFHYAITAEYWPDTGFRDSADVFAIPTYGQLLFRLIRHYFDSYADIFAIG
jgi:hypothetical protein